MKYFFSQKTRWLHCNYLVYFQKLNNGLKQTLVKYTIPGTGTEIRNRKCVVSRKECILGRVSAKWKTRKKWFGKRKALDICFTVSPTNWEADSFVCKHYIQLFLSKTKVSKLSFHIEVYLLKPQVAKKTPLQDMDYKLIYICWRLLWYPSRL